jgi:hypothetical protein
MQDQIWSLGVIEAGPGHRAPITRERTGGEVSALCKEGGPLAIILVRGRPFGSE